MKKCFIAMKKSYADFDIPIEEPICASIHEDMIISKVSELNAKRTKDQLRDEVSYVKRSVKLI